MNGWPLISVLALLLAGLATTFLLPGTGVNFIFWVLALSVACAFGLGAIAHKGIRQ